MAAIAHRHGAIVIDDLGSGALLDTAAYGLAHEPMPSERLAAGADVVLFSGDKLVGGPQAGIVAGRRDLVERMRRDPLARAVRPDKAILAAVATTLGLYRAGRAIDRDPRVADDRPRRPRAARARRVDRSAGRRARGSAGSASSSCASPIGGGSLPGQTLPSFGVGVRVRVAATGRDRAPDTPPSPILARVDDDELGSTSGPSTRSTTRSSRRRSAGCSPDG